MNATPNRAKERICELEGISEEFTQYTIQRDKEINMKKLSETGKVSNHFNKRERVAGGEAVLLEEAIVENI